MTIIIKSREEMHSLWVKFMGDLKSFVMDVQARDLRLHAEPIPDRDLRERLMDVIRMAMALKTCLDADMYPTCPQGEETWLVIKMTLMVRYTVELAESQNFIVAQIDMPPGGDFRNN